MVQFRDKRPIEEDESSNYKIQCEMIQSLLHKFTGTGLLHCQAFFNFLFPTSFRDIIQVLKYIQEKWLYLL